MQLTEYFNCIVTLRSTWLCIKQSQISNCNNLSDT